MDPFGSMDIDSLLEGTHQQLRRVEHMQQQISEVVGRGSAEGGLVKAKATNAEGLAAIRIDPYAMRLGSEGLGEKVVEAVKNAFKDLQSQTYALMREVLGDEMMDGLLGKGDISKQVQEMQDRFNMSADAAMSELDKVRRGMGI